MNLNGKYTIRINIKNDFNEGHVINLKVDSIKSLEENIRKLDKSIELYDKNNYMPCYQCNEVTHLDDMSIPEELDDVMICQECLQRILDGDIKFNYKKNEGNNKNI